MSGCQTCGGFGMHHDPIAHGTENAEPCCDYRDHRCGTCTCSEHPYSRLHPLGAPFAESLRREWRQRQTVYESHEWTNNDPDWCARCHVEWDDADTTCEVEA